MTTKLYKAKLFNRFNRNEISEINFYVVTNTCQFDFANKKFKNYFVIEKDDQVFYKEIREYKNSHITWFNLNKTQISVKNIADFESFIDRSFNSFQDFCLQDYLQKLIKNLVNDFNIEITFLNQYYYNGLELKKQMLSEKIARELVEKAKQTEREKQLNPLLEDVRKIKESVIDSFNEFLESIECLRDNENANYISVRNEYYRKLDFLENINNQLCENFC